MRRLSLVILLVASAGAWSATVYKWVDDNGVVHFSDQPNPKAEKLTIRGAQTYGSKDSAVTAPPPTAPPVAPTGTPVCVIDTPSAGQVFLDAESVSGHVTLANVGNEGARAALRLDGLDISALLGPSGSFALSQVERGEHTLTLQVTDAQGAVTCQASAVTFSLRQRSAVAPGVPAAPAAPTVPMAPGVGRRPNS